MSPSSRHLLLLLLIGAAVLLPGLGRLTMERQQELRVALCARTMVESGNWVIPRFQEQLRLRKPPLMYWAVGAVYKITGQTRSPFWTRIPGVISGLLLILLVYTIAARLFSASAGTWAVLCLITSYGFFRHTRLAETDITLTLFTTAAVYCIFQAFQDGRRWWWPLAGLAMGFGFLTKGPAAIAMPLLAMFFYAVGVEEGRRKFSWLGFAAMLLVAVGIAGPWYYTIHLFTQSLAQDGGQISQELTDTFAKTKHPGTLFYYVYTLPRMMLPAGLLLPFALVAFFKKGSLSAERFFVAGWFSSSFLLLSVIASKQSHYALLLVPVSSLLVGRWLADVRPTPPNERQLAAVAAGLAIMTAAYAYLIYPRTDGLSAAPAFLERVRTESESAPMTHVVGVNSALFDFYLSRHVHNTDRIDHAFRRAPAGDAIVAIKKHSKIPRDEIPDVAPLIDLQTKKFRYLFYQKP